MSKIRKIVKSPLTLQKTATISQAINKLNQDPTTGVIITEKGRAYGIVTGADIVRMLSNNKHAKTQKVTTIMSSPVTTFKSNVSLEKVKKVIDTKKFNSYPVIDENGKVEGIITQSDVVHLANDNLKFHRHVQNIVLVLFLLYAIAILFGFSGVIA